MAKLTTVTLQLVDDYGRNSSATFQSRVADPSQADIDALADQYSAISKLGVTSASISKPVTLTSPTTPTAQANRQITASLKVKKSLLNDSRGGTYTFKFRDPEDALVNADGTLLISDAAFTNWVELFDDGAGLAGIAGDWYISDGEELPEGTASDNAIIRGFLDTTPISN